LVGSGSEPIKLWDVNQEQSFLEIPVPLNSNAVQSVCSDYQGNLVYIGFGDGSVRWIDLRVRPDLLSLASGQNLITKHSGKIVSVCLQRKGESNGLLVSAGIRGHVVISDLRNPQDSLLKLRPHPESPLNTMTVHDFAPLIATGSSKQIVVIMKTDGTIINKIRHHDGFLGQRIGPVHCLAFHPYKLLLAAGGKDSYVSIMQSTSA
jgi:regulator-associated protein of mTOR